MLRFNALNDVLKRTPKQIDYPSDKISEFYATNVFTQEKMREFLPKEAYQSVMASINEGKRIDRSIANQVASSMKDWAMTKKVTHYTHWFQPLTGATAEKHDSFFTPISGGRAIERFDGDNLIQQEPDASSFPNGGIRNTFEARGYTAWDPTSPAFIIGQTLCVPTVFIAYTGEALDYKMPLLKTLNAIDKAATSVCQYFDKEISKVNANLGWEQEYFLIDKSLFNARPDIIMTGRALVGHNPAKGQQLDDHYFGSISERVVAFMKDFEIESHKLGIPVTTRHNEVAPNQFECAPMFEETNLANDHNLLMMDVMEKIARKHDFRVLFHEKPFKSVNGSGKHNNWSLSTNTGVNLLSPGKNPKTNLRFLTFFINTIKAIHDNADILRASIATAGNDHRLGANEAPPAIMSVFIGSQLSQMLDNLEENVKAGKMTPEDKTELKMSIGKLPQILLDNTDRNRTSPFAFTGNKFEFRAVGSSANCASAMIALNAIVAKQLNEFKIVVDDAIEKGVKKDEAILKELQKLIKSSKKIRFEGNGYGDAWVKEAEKRGLSNLKDTPRAIKTMIDKKTKKLFADLEVFTEVELDARYEIELENYILKLQIESRALGDIARNHILPTAFKYQNVLINNIKGMKEIFGSESKTLANPQEEILRSLSLHTTIIKQKLDEMLEERKLANKIEHPEKKALAYCDKVKPYFDEIKYNADKLELLIDDSLWPLPKLREILFTK
ncbi:MAG: glutamine synthetase type III [Bacteroidetes bacterium HGW-Bacteroidetes-12]|nr:MAG: glutamine synthetase type III [Bacteroidetes bacterium HGW-Bacteroidetes-12]